MKIKLTLLILVLPLAMFGQKGNYWSKTSAKNISQKDIIQYSSKVENPEYYNLDKASLATFLLNAPDRFKTSSSSTILSIPNPGGTMDRFEIFATQTIAKDQRRGVSTIKSYVGRNIDNKAHTLRITITPQGFYGMTLGSSFGQTLINPGVKNRDIYMVFSSKDVINTNEFKCEVEEIEKTTDLKSPQLSQKFIDDGILRRYRLAVGTTVEYSDYHLTQAGFTSGDTSAAGRAAVQAAIVVTIDRVNQIFERDLGVTLQLIANNDVLISLGDAALDGYTNSSHSLLINENQTIIDGAIGAANYDVGHVLCTQGGGLAQTPATCSTGKARAVTGLSAPVGEYFTISILAHELGHQFGASHTQSSNVNENRPTAVEPGSGTTIMSYAGVAAPNVQGQSDAMFHYTSISQVSNRFGFATTGGCAEEVTTGNNAPVITAVPNYTIPVNTPFKLEAIASDPNGDGLTYSWDQIDNEIVPNVPMPPASTSIVGPSFRTFLPSTNPARYFPALSTLVTNSYSTTWEVLPTVSRTLNFGVIVRDNNAIGGQVSNEATTLTVTDAAGPFRVTSQPGANIIWGVGDTETVTWDVANTNDVGGVNSQNMDILLSTDGGLNFDTVLISNTPNDGSENIVVPNTVSSNARIMIKAADNVFFDINEAIIEITATPPSCIGAQNILVQNVLSDSAVISWIGSQSNPTNGYDYVLNTTGTAPSAVTTPTASLAASSTTVTPPGLTPNTIYYFYIRANCGGGDVSAWSTAVSFRTTCTAIAAPLVENFDGVNWVNNAGIDVCWRRAPQPNNFSWRVRTGTTPQHTNTGPTNDVTGTGKYLYTEALGAGFSEGDEAILSTPPIDLSALTVPRMKFSYHMYGFSMGSIRVQVKEINATTFNTVFSISGQQQTSSTNPFIEQTIDLNAYAGQSVHIRFIGVRGANWGSSSAIDQFIIEETTSCDAPLNLSVSNLSSNSADLSWSTIGTALNGYEWVVMANGVTPNPTNAVATGTVASGTTTAQVTGLSSSTNYDAYVRSNCGATGLSNWSLITDFITSCGTITAPFVENFDGPRWVVGGAIDLCWNKTPESPNYTWRVNSNGTPSGNTGPSNDVTGGGKYLFTEASQPSGSTYSTGNEAIITAPPVDLSALSIPRMKFSYHMFGATMGTLRVEVKEISATTYTTLFTISSQQQIASNSPFKEQTIDLNGFVGQTVNIRFVGVRGAGFNSDIAIDQFIVEETTGCDSPSNLSVSNVSFDSVDLSWDPFGNALNGYEWVVMADGIAPDIATAITTGTVASGITTTTATGLSPLTDYDAYVRSNCGATGLSSWTNVINFYTGYCVSVANTDFQTSTTRVVFNTIDNEDTSTKTVGYSDFTSISTQVERNQIHDLTVQVNTDGAYTANTVVWIDWNKDNVFDNITEKYNLGTANTQTNGATSLSPLSITVPNNAVFGTTRMRVSTKFGSTNATPCENGADAEVEDYSIIVSPSLVTWTGATDNDWDTATNWSPNAVPSVSNAVTIPSGLTNYPTASNPVTVNNVTINSGASLIANSTFSGVVNYQRNLPTTNWYAISSPLNGESVLDFLSNNNLALSTTSTGVNQRVSLAQYDNTQTTAGNSWSYYTVGDYDGLNADDTTDNMNAGDGFTTRLAATGNIVFTGNMHTNDVIKNITTGAGNAFNLVGNPYLSFINSNTFLTTNSISNSNIDGTIWVWNQQTNSYDAQNLASSFKIAPAQGFFVKRVSGASVIFEENSQSHEATDTFQKNSVNPKIELAASDGVNTRNVQIYYIEGATTGFDIGYDSELFNGITSGFSIYSHLLSDNVGKSYQIQSLPNSDYQAMVVPIGIKATAGKEVTFTAEATNLPLGINIYLEDKETNTFRQLGENNSYKFIPSKAITEPGRFYIHSSSQVLGVSDLELIGTNVYSANQKINFANLPEGVSVLKLYDVLGKLIIDEKIKQNTKSIPTKNRVKNGVYLVSLKTERGVLTKKIIIN